MVSLISGNNHLEWHYVFLLIIQVISTFHILVLVPKSVLSLLPLIVFHVSCIKVVKDPTYFPGCHRSYFTGDTSGYCAFYTGFLYHKVIYVSIYLV